MRTWLVTMLALVLAVTVGGGIALAQAGDEFPLDVSLLPTLLYAVAFLGIAPEAAYLLMGQISKWLIERGWSDFQLRLASFALTALIACGAWLLWMFLVKTPLPSDWHELVNKLFAISFTSWGFNQFIHGWAEKRNDYGGLE